MLGFKFHEVMSGTYTFAAGAGRDGKERPMKFDCRAHAGSLLRHLTDHRADLDGHVDMEGFATRQPLRGEIVINPVLGKHVRYDFEFRGDDGKPYRFEGQKDVELMRFMQTMTVLPGRILDGEGREVATALLRFDTRRLPSLLGSFRATL